MRINALKRKLARGEAAMGVSVMIPSPQIVEMLGLLGVDWVLLDCEHGTISLESLELMAMAAESAGITAIARPATNAPDAIQAVLERGVLGIQAPHVVDSQAARRVIESVKFKPHGRRGVAAGSRPARYGFGLSMADYVAQANRETLVCVQIEDAEALDHLDDILTTPHIDVFFVGPSDLAQSMGYPGGAADPIVRTVIEQTLRTIVAAGRTAGCAGPAAALADYRTIGVTYLYTHLPTVLAAGWQALGSQGTA